MEWYGLEPNASYNNEYIVLTGEMLFTGKFNTHWQFFAEFSCECYCMNQYTRHIFVCHILLWSDCTG